MKMLQLLRNKLILSTIKDKVQLSNLTTKKTIIPTMGKVLHKK